MSPFASSRLLIGLCLAAGLPACAPPPPPDLVINAADAPSVAPRAVVELAAEAEGQPVPVAVQFVVAATGADRDVWFLNAFEDYRDPRNVSIAIQPEAQPGFRQRFGEPDRLVGRRIEVRGLARRETILLTNQGRPTGAYYFQTHLRVASADQIRLLD